jgi:tRNA threonylcarbamoyladenosine biosynthesis protein TsaE
MSKIFQIQTEETMLQLAEKLAQVVDGGAIIFLHGPLGAGKTTFARGFLRGFGYSGKVKSPTFTLVEPYDVNGRSLFHFDFYRLDNADALLEIGINEYFTPTSICLIEWAEKGFPLLPQPDLDCDIAFSAEGRIVKFTAKTARGEKILKGVS